MMNLTKKKKKNISKHHITHVLRDVIGFANSRHIFSLSLVRVKPTFSHPFSRAQRWVHVLALCYDCCRYFIAVAAADA